MLNEETAGDKHHIYFLWSQRASVPFWAAGAPLQLKLLKAKGTSTQTTVWARFKREEPVHTPPDFSLHMISLGRILHSKFQKFSS